MVKSKNTEVQKNAIYQNKTLHVNFLGNLLYQATKQHLIKQCKKKLKNEMESYDKNEKQRKREK